MFNIYFLDFPASIRVASTLTNMEAYNGFYTAYARTRNGRPVYERDPLIRKNHKILFYNRGFWAISDADYLEYGNGTVFEAAYQTVLPINSEWKMIHYGTYSSAELGGNAGCMVRDQSWNLPNTELLKNQNITKPDWKRCRKSCLYNKKCTGWNYNTKTKECKIYKATIERLELSQVYDLNMISGYIPTEDLDTASWTGGCQEQGELCVSKHKYFTRMFGK